MTDKLQQFIEQYNDQKVEFHSFSSGSLYQCVDSANKWIVEGLKLPAIIGTNAQDFPKKKEPHFVFIENTPEGIPNPGDLVIFKSPDGVGHISIFVKSIHKNLFTSFDQNYPTGSPCKLVNHNYNNVLGWMRPKKESMEILDDPEVLEELKEKILWYEREYPLEQQRVVNARKERDEALTAADRVREELSKAKDDFKNERDSLNEQIKQHKEQYNSFKAKLANELGTTQDEPAIIAAVVNSVGSGDLLIKERNDHSDTKNKLSDANKKNDALDREIESLKAELRAARGLKNASSVELLTELLKRLLRIKEA